MGICIFSPRLDLVGNSVRGIDVARRITKKYLVHAFDGTMTDTDRIDPKLPIARWRANSCGEAIWAASNGDVRTLERLVSQQRDLEAGDYDIRTPLHLASAGSGVRLYNVDVRRFIVRSKQSPYGKLTHVTTKFIGWLNRIQIFLSRFKFG